MRAVIRHEVDINQPLNLRRLSPVQKVIVAIRKEFAESSFFMKSKRARQQNAHRALIMKEDHAKELILAEIYKQLGSENPSCVEGERVHEIIIAVNPEYKNVLFDTKNKNGDVIRKSIFSHSDFLQYEISRVGENADFRRAFSDMPYLFRVTKKTI